MSDVDGDIELALLGINIDSIKDNASRKSYAVQYIRNLDSLFARKEKLKVEIKKKEIIIGWREEQKAMLDKAGSSDTTKSE